MDYKAYADRIRKPGIKLHALDAIDELVFDSEISSVFSVLPNIDIEMAAEVLFSFQVIVEYLNSICLCNTTSDASYFNIIFSSLKDAINLRTESFENYFKFYPSKDDDGFLTILVEKCRQKVRQLPGLEVVRDYISSYLTMFIDLQVQKFSSSTEDREAILKPFASIHERKYSYITLSEFCMAADSTLCIQALLALATDPNLTEDRVSGYSDFFFPWLCGIHKILEGYSDYNDSSSLNNLNSFFQFNNLKEYENRIVYFISNVDSTYSKSIYKLLISIYTTIPKAEKGMNTLTTKALTQAGGRNMFLYNLVIRITRSLSLKAVG